MVEKVDDKDKEKGEDDVPLKHKWQGEEEA